MPKPQKPLATTEAIEMNLQYYVEDQKKEVNHTADGLIRMIEEFRRESLRALDFTYIDKSSQNLTTYEITGWGVNNLLQLTNNANILGILRTAKSIDGLRAQLHDLKEIGS